MRQGRSLRVFGASPASSSTPSVCLQALGDQGHGGVVQLVRRVVGFVLIMLVHPERQTDGRAVMRHTLAVPLWQAVISGAEGHRSTADHAASTLRPAETD
ncbi:MAG: hypothetical protein OXT09_11925 [Myxococcales bacterium]|nr:hypothetical protein [Myxococcales bacterium]